MARDKLWIIIGAVVSLLLFAAGYFLVISPTQQQAADLRLEADNLRSQNQALASRLQMTKEQAVGVPEQLAAIDQVRVKIPDDLDMPELVTELERLAAQSGFSLTAITASQPAYLSDLSPEERALLDEAQPTEAEVAESLDSSLVANGQTVVIPISMTGTGSYAAVRTFVNELESSERAILVSNVSVGSDSDEEGGSARNLTVQTQVFSAPGAPWDIQDVSVPGVTGDGDLPPETGFGVGPDPQPSDAGQAARPDNSAGGRE